MTVKTVPVKVSPDTGKGPGWAWLTLVGVHPDSLSGQAQLNATDWALTLQRNQDSYFLASQSHWGASEVWHQAEHVQFAPDGLQLLLGPALLDALLADPRTVSRVQVGAQGATPPEPMFGGVLRFERGVLPSGASGQSPEATQLARAPKPIEPVVDTPAIVSEAPAVVVAPVVPTVAAAPTPSTRVWLIVLLLLLGAAMAAYGWWRSAPSSDPVGAAQGVLNPSSLPAACSQQAMQAAADDLIFLQGCVADKPDSKTVLAVIELAKQSDRCDLIQRLYAHQAQAGQVDVALAYAREFDPATFKGGCFKQADVQTALYWYENILQANPGRTEIAARVQELEKMK